MFHFPEGIENTPLQVIKDEYRTIQALVEANAKLSVNSPRQTARLAAAEQILRSRGVDSDFFNHKDISFTLRMCGTVRDIRSQNKN
jgi:hypothetical protein